MMWTVREQMELFRFMAAGMMAGLLLVTLWWIHWGRDNFRGGPSPRK